MYNLFRWLHILSLLVAIATNIASPFWRRFVCPAQAQAARGGIALLDDRLANIAYVVLLLTGTGMILTSDIPWSTPWVLLSFLLYGITFLLALAGYAPARRAQRRVAETKGIDSLEFEAAYERTITWGLAILVLVVAIIYIMSAQPPLWD